MLSSVEFEDGQEGFLRNFDRADLLHALFALFLFFEQLALTRDVAAVTLAVTSLRTALMVSRAMIFAPIAA